MEENIHEKKDTQVEDTVSEKKPQQEVEKKPVKESLEQEESSKVKKKSKPTLEKKNCSIMSEPHKLLMILSVIQIVLLIYVAANLGSSSSPMPTVDLGNSVDVPSVEEPELIDMSSIIDENDAYLGDENAPVTIIEFSDYECPFCKRFHEDTFSLIKKDYIETGKVKFYYMDLPLDFHANAQKAAEAAECAGVQGKYYEMQDLLFSEGVEGGVSSYKGYAGDLGLNQEDFDSCLDDGDMASEVNADKQKAIANGFGGTPSFILNGIPVQGAIPYEGGAQGPGFKDFIEVLLAEN